MKLLWTIPIAWVALAQAPSDLFDKAPPDVDNSLRERVKGFYQCHIDGTYRKAEKFVHEESQETFYQMHKQKYDSCETLRINYSENFTKAVVTQVCKGNWNISGNDLKVSMPISTIWTRTEGGGEWFWRHSPPAQLPTPFGPMDHQAAAKTSGAAGGTGSSGGPPKVTGGISMPTDIKAAGEMLMKQVTADKSEVKLSSYEPSEDTIVVTNKSGGTVRAKYEFEGVVPGFKAEFDKSEIPPGHQATLKFTMNPKDRVAKPTLQTRILIEPLMQQFLVKVTFAIPPEIEKQIPKK